MTRFVLGALAVVVMACSGDPTRPPSSVRTSYQGPAGGNNACYLGDLTSDFSFGCNISTFGSGGFVPFDDQVTHWEYALAPAVTGEGGNPGSLTTVEVRYHTDSTFGVRMDATPTSYVLAHDHVNKVYTWVPEAIDLTFVREAVQSKFVVYATGHLEGAYCITNNGPAEACGNLPADPAEANQLPIARFVATQIEAPYGASCSVWYQFDASTSSDVASAVSPGTGALSYKWEVNGVIASAAAESRADDGSGGSGATGSPILTREFCEPGYYTVRLLVDDREGGIDATRQTIYVPPRPTNEAPIARMSIVQTRAAAEGVCAQFSFNGSTSSDPNGDALTYSWSLDNGSAIAGPASLVLDVCSYGTHSMSLTVSDGQLTGSTTRYFEVVPPASPLSIGIIGPNAVRKGVSCTWTSFVSGGAAPFSYSWFSDGVLVSTADTYTAVSARGFTLSLQVTSADGQTRVDSRELTLSTDPTVCMAEPM